MPNKLGIGWYLLVSTVHQISSLTIPVLPWYDHSTVLTVFCLSGITLVLILPFFIKPSMLSLYYNRTSANTYTETLHPIFKKPISPWKIFLSNPFKNFQLTLKIVALYLAFVLDDFRKVV
jgi:hypothetical protein